MTTERLSNEFMEEMLNDAAWEDLAVLSSTLHGITKLPADREALFEKQ